MPKRLNDLWIHVTDSALMHLLMAGMESYKVRLWDGRETTNRGPVEVAGLLWGYVPESSEGYDHLVVQHATTDIVGARAKNWSSFSLPSALAKQSVVSARWPHLSMIGDFHTHPYEKYTDAERTGGWEASEGDRVWYEEHFAENVRNTNLQRRFKVSLVLTIAKLQRVREDTRAAPEVLGHGNVLRWQLGDFRYWLTAYSLDRTSDDDDSPLVLSPREAGWPKVEHAGRDDVYLDVPTIYGTERYFEAGDLR